MSLKVEKTIYDKLAATAGVTALVSTNIFFVNAAQGTAYPYITLNRVTTDPVPSIVADGAGGGVKSGAIRSISGDTLPAASLWVTLSASPSVSAGSKSTR